MAEQTSVPRGFGPAFLEWFRARTEAAWAAYEPKSVEELAHEYATTGYVTCQWQRNTRWVGGLSEEQIEQTERRWGYAFLLTTSASSSVCIPRTAPCSAQICARPLGLPMRTCPTRPSRGWTA